MLAISESLFKNIKPQMLVSQRVSDFIDFFSKLGTLM